MALLAQGQFTISRKPKDGQYTVNQYAKSTSDVVAPASGWVSNLPTLAVGEYLWMRTGLVIPPATNPTSWSTPVRLSGDKGDKGDAGTLNYIEWKDKWTIGNGAIAGWTNNGGTDENSRVWGENPFGVQSMLWKCVPNADNNASGGFETAAVKLDSNYAYRYALFVYINKSGGATYHGCRSVARVADNIVDGNPYFWNGTNLPVGKWHLLVGIIHPNSVTKQSGISGVYDMNGRKIYNGTDYKFASDGRAVGFRSYLYYSADTSLNQLFFNPMVHRLDGAEPAIDEILQIKSASVVDASFKVLDDAIKTKVNQTDFNSLSGRVSTAESTIVQHANKIESTVQKVDGKNAVYKSYTNGATDRPLVPYAKGDLWITFAGEIKQSTATRLSGSFIDADWVATTKYTDDMAVNNLQVGGSNILNNSGFWKTAGWNGGFSSNGGGYTINTTETYSGMPSLETLVGAGIGHSWIKLEANVEYTYSAIVKCNETIAGSNSTPLHIQAGLNNQVQGKIAFVSFDTSVVANVWKKIHVVFKITGDANSIRPFFYRGGNGTTKYWIAYLQMERGNKPSDWSPSRSDLNADIVAAQATADAKNRTYYSDTTPAVPTGGHKVGDLWYKISLSAGCYITYRWNGSAWAVINEYVSKAQQTITDSSITNLVTKTGINSLGAGDTLVSKINQTANEITVQVGKVQIGGRNLFLNSNFISDFASWGTNGGTRTIEPDTTFGKVAKIVATGGGNGLYQNPSTRRTSGKNYVISGYMKAAANMNVQFSHEGGTGSKSFAVTTIWQRFETQGVWNSGGSVCFYAGGAGTFYLANLQYEEGNKSSAWTPAPEDIPTIVGSTLSITDNKISLASKTIELNGKTIAKAIEAEDLTVGSRTGLSALEVKKNGIFYAKGSSADNASSLTIDSQTQNIEIVSPYSRMGEGGSVYDKTTLKMSGQTGALEIRNNNGVSMVSAEGIFANKAGQTFTSAVTGYAMKAAVAGLGFGTSYLDSYSWDDDRTALVGVAGIASNRATGASAAPAYGGYFHDLKACGLVLNMVGLDGGTHYMGKSETIVMALKSATVYLPASPIEGRVVLIKSVGGNVRLYAPSGYYLYDDASENPYFDLDSGSMGICFFTRFYVNGVERKIWMYNRIKW